MVTDSKTISVIVPVFNAENYLPACIESILVQTFKNFELLIINDGSTDDSLNICRRYAKNDKRIRVFNQAINQGSSVARNIAIENAKGKYIVCIDADDLVLENHLQSLYYSPYIPSGTLVHSNYLYSDNGIIIEQLNYQTPYYIENLTVSNNNIEFLNGQACSKLFQTDILIDNDIRYRPLVKKNVDHIFHLEYLMFINAYKNVGDRTYIYCNVSGSISKIQYSCEERFEAFKLMVPLTESVIERFHILNKSVKINLFSTPINALISSIFAVYRVPFKKNKIDRITFLTEVLKNYSFYLNEYFLPTELKKKAIKCVLKLSNIHIIDFCLITLFYFDIQYSLKYKGLK